MKQDAETLVDAFYAAWRARDIEASMSYFTDDIQVIFHFGNSVLFSGETRGRAAVRAQLEQSGDGWEFLELKQIYNHVSADQVRCRCPFLFRHVRTGALLEGTLRHVFSFRDGRICKFEAFLDIAMLNSFMRLVGLRAGALST